MSSLNSRERVVTRSTTANKRRKLEPEPVVLEALEGQSDQDQDPTSGNLRLVTRTGTETSSSEVEPQAPQEITPSDIDIKASPDQDMVAKNELINTPNDTASKALKVMSNSLVLAMIGKKLPAENLSTLRETCTSWNMNFVPALKKKHSYVRLSDDGHITKDPRKLEDFIKIIESSSNIPFTKLIFKPCIRLLPEFMGFISTYGSIVTNLKLGWPGWKLNEDMPISELRKIIFDCTPELTELRLLPTANDAEGETAKQERITTCHNIIPNLKQLAINIIRNLDRRGREASVNPAFTQLIVDVIQCSISLESLDLLCVPRDRNNFLRPALRGFLHDSMGHVDKLKTLKVPWLGVVDVQILLQLAQRNVNALRLEAFSIHIHCEDNEMEELRELLHKFFTVQSQTLKKLRIYFLSNGNFTRQTPILRVPGIQHLMEFTTQLPDQLQFKMEFGRLNKYENENDLGSFSVMFPNLTKFSYMSGISPYISLSRHLDRFYHPGVTTLRLALSSSICSRFTAFQDVFPSLTRFELTLIETVNRETKAISIKLKQEFDKIWTTWPALTSLYLFCEVHLDLDLDVFLTGVSRSRLEGLRHEFGCCRNHLEVTLDSLRAMLKDKNCKKRPGMSDLQHLREFTIVTKNADDNKPKLTDMGGYFGVALAASSLQRVVINGHGQNFISEQCRAFIRKTLGICAEISV